MHKRHSSTIPPTLLVRDSNTSTLHDLRLLITTDKFQKVEESRDIERVLTQLKALKQASRELHSTRDRCEALQEAFKKEGDPSFFYSLYKLHFQNLQHKIIDRRLNDPSLSTSPLACLSQKNIVTVTRFLSFLRSNPQTITKALCNHHSEDLYNLIKINPSVLKPTSIPDILLYSLFDSPNFTEEQKLRQDLWKDIFVSLIKDKKGDNFMLEALERYMRLYQWSPKGALEITLMKLLRQGEDALKLLEEENSGRKKSSLSRTHSFSSSMIYLHPSGSLGASAPYHHANAVEMDRFLDSACLEILGILHHYVPISLVNLTQAILHDLPQKLHHYATIQVMVKFFFYKFLGKVICYPEFFGLCEDHFISEKRRQRILFTVHQRLYRYVTAVTSSVPGWSRRSLNIDARIRAQVEKIVALFTLPNSSDQALTNVHDLGQPPILPSHFSQVPSPLAFPSITPTLLMSSEDIIELYDFLSTSTADPQEQPDTSSRFSDILFELLPVISILKGQESFSALFHVKPGGERILDDMTPSFLSLDFMSPTNDLEENVTCREETQVVGEALFKVLENYGDASIALPPGKFSSLPPGSEGLHEAIRLAIQSARFYNYLGDAVSFQKALGYLEKLPDDMTRDNHSGLIRLLARGIERTKAVRDLRYRERQAWLAYLQEFESQLRHAATRLESRCSNLRLHIFYSTFRATKTYEKHRSSLLELSGRIQLDEGEAAQVENYLQTSKVCDFIPGDERFHLFCLRIQALCCSAIANLWTCDGYSRESSLFHSRSSSATIPSLPSPPSSSASSFHSMHLTAPAIDSRDPLAVRSLAFANHAASDFPSAIQLRISTLLLSEFFAAFRSSEVDGWFAEFVSDFDPPDAEPESKASSAPFSTPSLSGLAEVSDKPLARFCDSPTHSLSSCSQSPISDSSASASSVAISLPINSMPPSPLVVASRSDYLSLCNQVTLHHSPLRKLRLLFSLELLIVANLSATDTPGTDSIINEIERVFRRIRPRHLFRDLQLIAAFVPNSILDLTDEGKAFWDFSLASLSLKKEAVDRAVSRATSLIDAMTRRPASSDDPLSSDQLDLLERRQQSEALRLFTLAAKEGHAEAQRELGILYLSLPSLTVDLPQSSPSFLGALYSGSNTSNYPPRGPDGDKYDPANVESALYWFGRAAAQGDAFSVQYLTHRGGAFSLPPSLRSHNSGANTISRPTIRAQSAVYRSSSTPPSPKVSRSPTGSSVSKLPRCLDSVQKFSA